MCKVLNCLEFKFPSLQNRYIISHSHDWIQVIKHWKGVYAESKGLRKCQFPFCLIKGSRTALEEVTGPCNKSKLHDFHFLFFLSSNCNSYYLLKFICQSPVIGTWIGGLSSRSASSCWDTWHIARVQCGECSKRWWFRNPKEGTILVFRFEGEKTKQELGKASEKQGHFTRTPRGEWKITDTWGRMGPSSQNSVNKDSCLIRNMFEWALQWADTASLQVFLLWWQSFNL